MKMKLCLTALFLGVMMMVSGCYSTGKQPTGGASRERYFLGTYSAVFPCSIMNMDKAVRNVCSRASLYEVGRSNSMNSCRYEYKDINQVRVYITLLENNDQTTTIKIKVATTGDKESSQKLLLEIERQLRAQGAI